MILMILISIQKFTDNLKSFEAGMVLLGAPKPKSNAPNGS